MEKIKQILEERRPGTWEEIPDIDLYMDQVLSYMPRQHAGLELGENLTSAMINNYIKKDLLPRAKGKKYDRQHIAYLTAICLLKQVISVSDAGALLNAQIEEREETRVREFYEKYTKMLDEEFREVSGELKEKADRQQFLDMALRLAVASYARKLACEQILKELEQSEDKK